MTTAVGAGNHYSLFFKDGVVYSVGENNEAQLGRGAITATGTGLPDKGQVNLPEGFTGEIVDISAGMLHGAFLTASGEVYTWGDNNLGKLGQGTTSNYESLTPTKVAALDGVVIEKIWMANGASYALSDDGQLWAWGQNTNGQLGNGLLTNTGTPVAISKDSFGGANVVDLSYGTSFALVLTDDGKVWAFGSNVQGQLGPNGVAEDGSFIRRSAVPIEVDIPGNVVHVSSGTNTSFAITDDGKVWGWGQSDFGQLLNGTIVDGQLTEAVDQDTAIPQEIQGLPADVIDIHVGSRWVIALTESGEVWAWGRNDEGWLGVENATGALETLIAPTRIPGFEGITIVSISGGPNHSLAVDSEGNVWGWGNMNQSRLGTTQVAGTWASGPILIPLENDGRRVVIGETGDDAALGGGDLAAEETGLTVYGFGGNDLIRGSLGSDLLTGGVGDDSLVGRAEDDELNGAQGDDSLNGGEGNDALDGGADADFLAGGAGLDLLQGGEGNDTLNGGADADTLEGGAGLDSLAGGAGNDTISGDAGDDTLNGGVGDDSLDGGADADILMGGAGLDLLQGGEGDDTLNGGADADTLEGGAGLDSLAGGAGNDTISGDAGDDSLNGGVGDDSLDGGADADFLAGGAGLDLLQGGEGDDTLNGGADADTLEGGAGLDSLAGGAGNDTISGDAGDDSITGGLGVDSLTGGDGADHFVFVSKADVAQTGAGLEEVITDFRHDQGDVIDLGGLDPDLLVLRDQQTSDHSFRHCPIFGE